MAPGDGNSITKRTPFALDLEAAFVIDRDVRWEYVGGVALQLEQVPAFGLVTQIRRVGYGQHLAYYGTLGAKAFLSPFTLAGPVVGGGIRYPLGKGFDAWLEVLTEVFLLGNDLNVDGSLVMLNGATGIRLGF